MSYLRLARKLVFFIRQPALKSDHTVCAVHACLGCVGLPWACLHAWLMWLLWLVRERAYVTTDWVGLTWPLNTHKYIHSLTATDCVQTIYASSIYSCLFVVVDMNSTHAWAYVPETSTLRLITCFFLWDKRMCIQKPKCVWGKIKDWVCKSEYAKAWTCFWPDSRVCMQKPEHDTVVWHEAASFNKLIST